MECGLELVIGRLLLKSNLGVTRVSEEREKGSIGNYWSADI